MGQYFACRLPDCHGRSPSDSCRNYPSAAIHPPCQIRTHAPQQKNLYSVTLIGARQAASFDVLAEAVHARLPSRDCERGNSLAPLHAPSTGMQPRDRPRALLPVGGPAKRCGGICGICLAPGFYVCAMAIFEVVLALTFPSLRSVARCAPMAAFNLRCVPAGNVARDGASGVAARALAA
jgi:hypothetical protein